MKAQSGNIQIKAWDRIALISLIFLFFIANCGVVNAQRTAIKKEDVPEAVVKALETHYLPADGNIKWYIQDRRMKTGYYVMTASGRNIESESVFDKDGNLIRSTTVMENVKLPSIIHKTIAEKYPGWRITEDRVIIPNFEENKKLFHVLVEKNGKMEELDFNANGESILDRDIMDTHKVAIKKEKVPKAVLEAVAAHYLPASGNIKWYVQDRRLKTDYYVISATGKNIECESVFDKDGNLVWAITVMKNLKLPSTVHQAIAEQYPGWRITKDRVVIHNFEEKDKRFEILIVKDGESQTIYFDKNGEPLENPGV